MSEPYLALVRALESASPDGHPEALLDAVTSALPGSAAYLVSGEPEGFGYLLGCSGALPDFRPRKGETLALPPDVYRLLGRTVSATGRALDAPTSWMGPATAAWALPVRSRSGEAVGLLFLAATGHAESSDLSRSAPLAALAAALLGSEPLRRPSAPSRFAVPPPVELDRMNRRLRESEERLRMLVDYAVDAIWCLEVPLPIGLDLPAEEQARRWMRFGRVSECNDAFAERMGANSTDEVRGRPIRKLTGHWLERPSDALVRLAASRYAAQERLEQATDARGRPVHLRVGLHSAVGPDIVQRVWFIEQDVTSQINEDRRLRESRDLFEAVLRTSLDGIAVLDDGFCMLDCNEALEQLFARPRSVLIGSSARSLLRGIRPADFERLVDAIRSSGSWRGRIRVRRPDRTQRDVELSVRYTSAEGGRFYCFTQDVTVQLQARQAEQQRQSQIAHISRLSTLGEMASGIAHELNQPLAAIMNYSSGAGRLLVAADDTDESVVQAVARIAEQARRAGDIIQRMRGFARKGDGTRARVPINEVIEDSVGFMNLGPAHRSPRLVLELDGAEIDVLADPIQIEQVLVNLVLNAQDAVSADGDAKRARITVRTLVVPGSSHVEVQVEDDGPGIDDKAARRLFDPFYTTKEQGLGLGLSISTSIIANHGGRMWLTHPPGGGACFHFTLPVASATMSE